MKSIAFISAAVLALVSPGVAIAQSEPEIASPNANVPHLGVNGTFTLDISVPASRHDPRNPARIVFNEMRQFSFYRDLEGREAIAQNCEYVYRGAAPDPFYYPRYQSSIWDQFELASDDPACSGFRYVILRAPHGEPIHMHFRYGGEDSSFQALLNMSTGASDENRINPWWSLYCAEGVTGCD
ncbi:hypothetical protein H6G20_18190 [Desertifilum sp. FACHB-1129]|uniref:Uncharacterized protein n=1 Tax=Desertifilum tharense IPPAS B-1220 TaxID=1781255 RepID=A0A1E5QIQ8_9CYAN|nr:MULTISPECIES: hypothetical protein [Desertifilum]MDA0210171.1 hypothetical protein [Cyanobacteria bacterium FC1]MBD2313603.1 hypothetical protein [Desertifilum sp. FACHB-1129]MBD2320576.1 hypothetical protein [Desertifilum sp. FACHB-866]MBD2330704.1 hypothetical protein [Desertifilum sp. FACHB-868]OEJ74501.1 hypothetical protein BH720_14875 [Desertifilum tharense IPPAS B-1220]